MWNAFSSRKRFKRFVWLAVGSIQYWARVCGGRPRRFHFRWNCRTCAEKQREAATNLGVEVGAGVVERVGRGRRGLLLERMVQSGAPELLPLRRRHRCGRRHASHHWTWTHDAFSNLFRIQCPKNRGVMEKRWNNQHLGATAVPGTHVGSFMRPFSRLQRWGVSEKLCKNSSARMRV